MNPLHPPLQVIVAQHTKGSLVKLLFPPEQLARIDFAIPQGFIDDGTVDNPFYHVMDYNDPKEVFGQLVDLRLKARQLNIILINT